MSGNALVSIEVIMMTCQQAAHLISKKDLQRLKISEWLSLRFHLALCQACRSFDVQVALMSVAARHHFDRTGSINELDEHRLHQIREVIEREHRSASR